MPNKDKKLEKRLISVIVNTNRGEILCGEEIKHRLAHLMESPKYDVQIIVKGVHYANNNDEHITQVIVIGKGWEKGVKIFFDRLSGCGYKVQSILAAESSALL